MSPKSSWEEFFDHHATEYMQNVFTKNTDAEVVFISDELDLPKGSSILDVGCGTGRHSVGLAKLGYRMTGVDLSSGMLAEAEKAAKEAGVEIELVKSDASKFSFERKFDAAICLCEGAFGLIGEGIDPLKRDLKILKNISNSLKPGAKLILTVLNAFKMIRQYNAEDISKGKFDPINIAEHTTMEFDTPEGKKSVMVHEKGFTATEIRLLMERAGLEIRSIYGGTAGNWGQRPIDPDEYEIMVIAVKI